LGDQARVHAARPAEVRAEPPPPAPVVVDPAAPPADKKKLADGAKQNPFDQQPPDGMERAKMPDGSEYVPPSAEDQAKHDQAKEIAAFVEWCLEKIDLDFVFTETLSALEFGYSLAELVWTRDNYEGKQVVCLEKIAHRDPEQLYLEMDSHGNFTGVTQLSLGQNIQLTPEKLFLFTHNKRFGNLYGDSDLRGAYRSYWAKKFIINFWNVFLERMGSPMTLIKYPTGADQTLKDTLKKILTNLGSKTEVLVPEGVQVDLIEAKRSGNADYNSSLTFHNNSIARAILMATLFGTGGEDGSTRGSDSQSFLQLRILFKMADQISRQLAKELTCQVIKQLVALNYGEDAAANLMPEFVWQDYGQFEGMKIADEIRQLHAAGIIDMDQTDVNYVRSVLGLPLRDEDDKPDEVIRPAALPLTGQGAAQPPAANQGNTRADKGGSAESDSTGSNPQKNSDKAFALVLKEVHKED
jgi:phage gp29-like protein